MYQSVFISEVFATMTSLRIPSTSCAYQSGNVSLSPTVTSMPYGSTESSISFAKSRVSVCCAREAACQFAKSGTNARPEAATPQPIPPADAMGRRSLAPRGVRTREYGRRLPERHQAERDPHAPPEKLQRKK